MRKHRKPVSCDTDTAPSFFAECGQAAFRTAAHRAIQRFQQGTGYERDEAVFGVLESVADVLECG